jgi:threonine/homoserine/homoserine lactone efflux protein
MLAPFALVMLLGAMSPGPDFAVVVRRAAVSGRGPGTLTALGVAAGVAVWAVAAATGVAALVAVSAVVYTAVKLVGAAYLLYLGIRALLAARRAGGVEVGVGASRPVGAWTAFRQGLVCNLFNPKAAVFFVALLPQFLPDRPGLLDTLALSAVSVAVTGLWFVTVANLVGAFRRLFLRPRLRRAVDAVTGTALVTVGIRLAAATRTT